MKVQQFPTDMFGVSHFMYKLHTELFLSCEQGFATLSFDRWCTRQCMWV